MNSRLLLAAALLCTCAARATPIIQTVSASGWGSGADYNQSRWNTALTFSPYSSSEPLTGALLLVQVHAEIIGVECNPFAVPMLTGVSNVFDSTIGSLGSKYGGWGGSSGVSSALLAPGKSIHLTSSIYQSYVFPITDLSQFTNGDISILLSSHGLSMEKYGSHSMRVEVAATLLYNVPDSGSTLVPLAICLGVCVSVHRLRKRRGACSDGA